MCCSGGCTELSFDATSLCAVAVIGDNGGVISAVVLPVEIHDVIIAVYGGIIWVAKYSTVRNVGSSGTLDGKHFGSLFGIDIAGVGSFFEFLPSEDRALGIRTPSDVVIGVCAMGSHLGWVVSVSLAGRVDAVVADTQLAHWVD